MARKDYIVGSGNVFEDLGHRRPAEALAKAELARKIAALIAERGLTQASAAELLSPRWIAGQASKWLTMDRLRGVGSTPP
jgi:hypothetical protein